MAYQLLRRPKNNKVLEFKLVSHEMKAKTSLVSDTTNRWIARGTHLQLARGMRYGEKIYAIREAATGKYITTSPVLSIKPVGFSVILETENSVYTFALVGYV